MSVYLVRHTTPLVEKGICYGQSDIDVTETFEAEAAVIKPFLPATAAGVFSSPLRRCRLLAETLFPRHSIRFEHDLKEIHCGEWEMLHWDAISKEVIDPWMQDFVNVCIPGGESYVLLHQRVTACFEKIAEQEKPAVIFTHGGVIRSILAHITQTPLQDSFAAFRLHYGCVVRIDQHNGGLQHHILSNIETAKEQHKPSTNKKG